MKFLLLVCGILAAAQCASLDGTDTDTARLEEWNAFKSKYNKKYKSQIEEEYRRNVFMQKLILIAEHNQQYKDGTVSYELEMNKFGDMQHHEVFKGFKIPDNSQRNREGRRPVRLENVVYPFHWDWRPQGAVTPVKDQGDCNSSWAFSMTGVVEGFQFAIYGELISLSEQNLVDCDTNNHGCEGGDIMQAYRYISLNYGIDTEASYPYEGKKGPCRYNATNKGAEIYGFYKFGGDEELMKQQLVLCCPLTVVIAANEKFLHYKPPGIFYDPDCKNSDSDLNHPMLAVGYGTENGSDYYIVKNSFSENWGDKGYIKMARNRNNNCGIASYVTCPI